eukprot:CAMPEP_0185738632 /NCGR_PEP_ID=MMETSP1171-20130828/33474_1 /TAXON_ID=374046 /ORGANISM="Helicotheca tamensis, Strain CCMP826" /LENGTH=356 /DNA_ID=CAMNT_0028409943 /DNA_START=49 /DNA_END=1119 /DNA_ORIENTATION=-
MTALAIRRPLPTSVFLRSGTQVATTITRQGCVSTFSGSSPSSLFSTSSSASSFQAPIPPKSKGQSVYEDIDISADKEKLLVSSKRNGDPNAVFVVNGSSRGIGLQFVKSLVDRSQGTILACCRSPDSADKLNEFLSSSPQASQRVKTIQLDVEDQASIDAAAEEIKTSYNRVDCLFNVAGILGDGKSDPGPERSLSKLDRDWVEKTMAVNVIGPVMLSQALAPMMISKKRRGKKKSTSGEEEEERAQSVIVNLSARVGSISDNELGGWYSYRFSKSALNQATRTMAHELKRQGTWTVALHPGTTNTDLSKPFQRNVQEGRLFPVEFTVGRLLDVVDGMEDRHSGGLYDWSGTALPF